MATADQLIGERIHHLMWRKRMTQGQLAARLGLTQTGVSKKVHGERPWFAAELIAVAEALNTQVSALLPVPGEFDPPVTQESLDHTRVDADWLPAGRRIPSPANRATPEYDSALPPKNLTLRNELVAASLDSTRAA
jgi:transcriptional regulator with XRE-family HTH domain